MDKIRDRCNDQAWDGLQVVDDLPGRGRGVLTTRQFCTSEVVCDYHGTLMGHKEGKDKYLPSAPNATGFMFAFQYRGSKMWIDATVEETGQGQSQRSRSPKTKKRKTVDAPY